MDLLSVLPGFATKPHAHILPPLERGKITTVDLITLDTLEIAKRAHVPPTDVRRLSTRIVEALHGDLGFERTQTNIGTAGEEEPSSSIHADAGSFILGPATKLQPSRWNAISTMEPALDALLGGGIPTGYITEVTGERYVADKLPNWNRAKALTLTLVTRRFQWERQDPIPPQPPPGRAAGQTKRPEEAGYLRINRAPTCNGSSFPIT